MRIRAYRWPWLVALAALLAIVALPAATLAADFGQPVPGQRVYDRAGALTADEVARIEERAAAVEAAGSPVVVFLQARDADYDKTVADGRDLMEAWDIQSAPDARNGIVIFFNLKPGDLQHGDYAVIAGRSLVDGNLPRYELNRIADDMQPVLKGGDITGATILALDAIEHNLTFGPPPPPPPSAAREFADAVAGGPLSILNIIGIVASAVAGWFLAHRIPTRRLSNAPVEPATTPPTNLSPALAGSLVAGSISDTAIGATLLDLTARGGLAIEPVGKKKIQIRLVDESVIQPGYERMIWDALASQADPAGAIGTKQLGKVRKSWGGIRKAIRAELIARGWFASDTSAQRQPFWITGTILYTLTLIAVVLAIVAESPWVLIGFVPLGMIGTLALVLSAIIPNTTLEGDKVAAPWRGYQRYLRLAGKNPQVDIDLDTAVPYALALSAGQSFSKRLERASAAGYLPAWMGGPAASGAYSNGFFPYWVAFNSSVAPSGGGAGATGASAGSGAAGGSF
ncbi:MAG TPA: DUF2207 domain-containing protein [Thermomicrobiales bacterium]|nr:DUF2207 domain-containing protein [Thermomicrobiales bacterium]HQZ91320.1 DUF2207 domain-containing protein [Thermomicrobiales bacterium]